MSKSTNAGVHNAIGIEFQKHCALYLLFDNYSTLKNLNYFICIEHHDDVLFCHYGKAGELDLIQSYQVKKASTAWGLTKDLYDLLSKMAGAGRDFEKDPIPKSKQYRHQLNFATNSQINLVSKKTKTKPSISALINESNTSLSFLSLPKEIQDLILPKIESFWKPDKGPLVHVDYISFAYLDLPKTSQNQIDMLETQFRRLVNPSIADASAAMSILLRLFREVETTLNNGNISQLLDKSKRISSEQINKAIGIINTRQKAYNFWRQEAKQLSIILMIPIADQQDFDKYIQDSFDLFKDKKQAEHRKIFDFVDSKKALLNTAIDEISYINDLYLGYQQIRNSPLTPKLLKAAIVAAHIETKYAL